METGPLRLLTVDRDHRAARRARHSFVLVLDIRRQTLQLFQEDERAMRWNLEALAAGFAGHVVVDTDEMVLDLAEHGAGTLVGATGHLRLLGAADPADRIIVRAAAARALQPCRTLLGFLGKELALVHVS
jgi:hypothetical protein